MFYFSQRFQKNVHLTNHARDRMKRRYITEQQVKDLIESGKIKYSNLQNAWLFKTFQERDDNLICAAIIIKQAIIIKTIMINWELKE